VSIHVDPLGSGIRPARDLVTLLRKHFDLTPKGIIDRFGLKRPIFRATSNYGHFGRSEFPWEQTGMVDKLA